MKKLFFLLFPILLFSCENKNEAEHENEIKGDQRLNFTILPGERVGLITAKNCMPEEVLQTYGELAAADSVYLGEGIYAPGVVLFPKDPRNRVEIFWDSYISKKYPAFIRIAGDETGTDWRTPDGLTVGMGIAEVEKLNGNTFTIFGFGWDYGGYVTDYGNGRLNTSVGLRFKPSVEEYSEKIMGEINVLSNGPELIKAAPVIDKMEVRILAKEKLPECIAEKVGNYNGRGRMNVRTVHIDGIYHYWLNDGAATYDGTEVILDGECNELCAIGGVRPPMECSKTYLGKEWELVWEE